MNLEIIGKWAFIIGSIFSITSVFTLQYIPLKTTISILFLLGITVGLFNISHKNAKEFLMGVMALTIFSLAGLEITSMFQGPNGETGELIKEMLANYTIFIGAAGLVIAKRLILYTTKKPKLIKKLLKKI
jgi:hypothetical protein